MQWICSHYKCIFTLCIYGHAYVHEDINNLLKDNTGFLLCHKVGDAHPCPIPRGDVSSGHSEKDAVTVPCIAVLSWGVPLFSISISGIPVSKKSDIHD